MLVADIDPSTQRTKVMLCRTEDGKVIGQGTARHPRGTECDPGAWWAAWQKAGEGPLDRVDAIGIGGQQYGVIVLDETGGAIRPALLWWNDLRSADQAAELVAEFGRPGWRAEEIGSVPTASFTVTKPRWRADHETASEARTATVQLPHDWLTWRLPRTGATLLDLAAATTARGDASGSGQVPDPGEYVARGATRQPPGPRRVQPHRRPGRLSGRLSGRVRCRPAAADLAPPSRSAGCDGRGVPPDGALASSAHARKGLADAVPPRI
jgi:xylulokinase